MTPTMTEHEFATSTESAQDLAGEIARRLALAIEEREVGLIALSGGSSPVPVFQALRNHPLDWGKVIVAQVDERWVSQDAADSNARLIRENLLQGEAAAARFVTMKTEAATAAAAQLEVEAAYRALPLPFDVILLGMGEDGHTASLFSGARQLDNGLTTDRLTLAIDPPSAPHERMSLSLFGLTQSRFIAIQISGEAKREAYARAQEEGSINDLPIRAILRQRRVPTHVWISE